MFRSHASQTGLLDHSVAQRSFGLNAIVLFFSTRVIRGGPRLLLHLALCLGFLMFLMRFLPAGISDAAFGTTKKLWRWTTVDVEDELLINVALIPTYDNDSTGGGRRIVVFGTQDIATPIRLPGTEDSFTPSWTERLCVEVQCQSYLSFIPKTDDPRQSMTFNDLYAAALDGTMNQSTVGEGPGFNYSFVEENFPAVRDLPDLTDQITSFLSMPKLFRPPNETLWVFSLGTWDIWSLASIPRDISGPTIDSIISRLFEQVERLYQSALDNASIAWSDINSTPAVPASTSNPVAYRAMELATLKTRKHSRRFDQQEGENNDAANEIKSEIFRILIPRLFDPSLSPGWHSGRPKSTGVHSKAEQMRNAAFLTARWNSKLDSAIKSWILTSDPKQDEGDRQFSGEDQVETATADSSFTPTLSGASAAPTSKEGLFTANHSATVLHAYPLRDAITYDLPDYLMEIIVDRQFRNAGLEDANGVGKKPANQGFLEVSTPCLNDGSLEENEGEDDDDVGDESFTIREAKSTAEGEQADSDDPSISEEASGDSGLERRRSSESQEVAPDEATTSPDLGPDSSADIVTICSMPQEYLFFTPFTLSPRAIASIARAAAEMVLRNDTVRARWSRTNHALPYGKVIR